MLENNQQWGTYNKDSSTAGAKKNPISFNINFSTCYTLALTKISELDPTNNNTVTFRGLQGLANCIFELTTSQFTTSTYYTGVGYWIAFGK